MIKTISKKEYNTETAKFIKKYTYGSFGDPAGYEECLFETTDGYFFIYVRGGEESIYTTEDIKRISKAKANEWIGTH